MDPSAVMARTNDNGESWNASLGIPLVDWERGQV